MATYAVYVCEEYTMKYLVDANSADDARRLVEKSPDPLEEFGGSMTEGVSYVDVVIEL